MFRRSTVVLKDLYKVASGIHFNRTRKGTRPSRLWCQPQLKGGGFVTCRITPGDWFAGGEVLGATKPYGPGWLRTIGKCVFGKFEEKTMAFLR